MPNTFMLNIRVKYPKFIMTTKLINKLIDLGREFPRKSSQNIFSRNIANSKKIIVIIAALKITNEDKPKVEV